MVVPKSSSCASGCGCSDDSKSAKKSSTKRSASAKKKAPVKPATASCSDEALKKRLKKVLEGGSSKDKVNVCERENLQSLFTSEVQQFLVQAAKKEAAIKARSTKKPESPFTKVDKNKPSTSRSTAEDRAAKKSTITKITEKTVKTAAAVKKSTVAKKTTTSAKKPTVVKKPSTNTTTKKPAAACSDGTCGGNATSAKKIVSNTKSAKPAAAGTKRKTVAKPKVVPKKPRVAKRAAAKCAPCGSSCNCGDYCGCDTSGTCDGCCDSNDDSDDDSYDSYTSYTSYTSYSDEDDDDCCASGRGGGCCPPNRNAKGKSGAAKGQQGTKSNKTNSNCQNGKQRTQSNEWIVEDLEVPSRIEAHRRNSWICESRDFEPEAENSTISLSRKNVENKPQKSEKSVEMPTNDSINQCRSLTTYSTNGVGQTNGTGTESDDSEYESDNNSYLEVWNENYETSSDTSDYTFDEDNVDEEEMSEEDDSEYYSYEEESTGLDETDTSQYSTGSPSEYSYNGSNSIEEHDQDYVLPEGVEEDLIVRRGEAIIYSAGEDVPFDSDASLQIFEVHNETFEDLKCTVEEVTTGVEDCELENSYDSCPELVPIDFPEAQNFDEADLSDESSDGSTSLESFETNEQPNLLAQIVDGKNSDSDLSFSKLLSEFQIELNEDSDRELAVYLESFKAASKGGNVTVPMKPAGNVKSPKLKSSGKTKLNNSSSLKVAIETVAQTESKFYNSVNSCQVVLWLKTPIYFHGALELKLLAGGAECYGYSLPVNEKFEAFSPRGNNLMLLTPQTGQQNNSDKEDLHVLLESLDLLAADIQEIVENFNSASDALILLSRNSRSKKLDMVNKYMREEVFPSSNANLSGPFCTSEIQLHCRLFTETTDGLQYDINWNSLQLTERSRMIVVGGKGVGKSTLLRYTINRNLCQFSQFLLIDLDIGQPEVFIPQTISATLIDRPLLGPGYYYDFEPIKSYFYGDVNVVLFPSRYVSCLRQLLKDCTENEQLKNIPWIVNTMGYSKGFGKELLSIIFEHLQPTDVVQMQSQKDYNNFNIPLTADNVRLISRNVFIEQPRLYIGDYNFVLLDSLAPVRRMNKATGWDMSPKDIRMTMIVSALGNLLTEFDDWITDVTPYCVPFENLNILNVGSENFSEAELLQAINVNLVYLVDTIEPEQCFGLGIVRAIDYQQKMLYLLPSVSSKTLEKVTSLAISNIPLPSSILLNQGPRVKGHIAYTYNTNDSVSSKHVPQHIYRPQHFLSGSGRNMSSD